MSNISLSPGSNTPQLTIIVPSYNEELRLPPSLEKIAAYLSASQRLTEVIVVNDGSKDRTAEVAASFADRITNLRVVENGENRGKGYSVRHGMQEARGEFVLFSDADLSAPIEELDKLLQAVDTRAARVAIGSRALDRSLVGVHQSAFREYAGRFFNLVMRISTGLAFEDTQCGFKLFERQAAHEIFKRQLLERFGFDVEVLLIAKLLGYKTVEIPVRWDNVEGSKVGMFSGLDGFVDLWRVRRNQWTGKYK